MAILNLSSSRALKGATGKSEPDKTGPRYNRSLSLDGMIISMLTVSALFVSVHGAAEEDSQIPKAMLKDALRMLNDLGEPQKLSITKGDTCAIGACEDSSSGSEDVPRTLYRISNCSHTFCEQCLRRSLHHIRANGNFPASCPFCPTGEQRITRGAIRWLADNGIFPDANGEPLDNMYDQLECAHRFWALCLRASGEEPQPVHPPIGWVPYQKNAMRDAIREKLSKAPDAGNHRETKKEDDETKKEEDELKARKAREEKKTRDMMEKFPRCPSCEALSTPHYRGHHCHHIKCKAPDCDYEYCVVCMGPYNSCGCPWEGSTFCNAHGEPNPYTGGNEDCGCPPCPECAKGSHCAGCESHNGGDGTCPFHYTVPTEPEPAPLALTDRINDLFARLEGM